ncbi:acyl-CoA/acyl-ACP dehydrogenase [Acidovorax sp. NCPPB 3859]|nr:MULTISPECIES: acyl-CoA dehydrogenase family protein [unclassified Acidovorax]MDA8450976.1 acyl-CoA/acyl-ACP dehydrogenase [Acidovorax sp. GBBC 3297]MDA8460421.1 acyl-CoA/acyl-ACP dehydrogenase [Acidovorax sp. GBBC 3333]MDA8465457.1 acyl-CoA/acyl-ACP dehydrogenase [Acidovorax sp. GBBC 3332]MDA8470546.1 acyl-CoA/acyl-ACP dehydrogenase [Acidovorax sp. GBBC 3299]WCM83720.1 acyl-CoA/acyl-ACP dehydrogenase [Acidovorax sp. NCPPB 3859]
MTMRDSGHGAALLPTLRSVLTGLGTDTGPADGLRTLVDAGCADLPAPGGGATADRWRALGEVAAHDLPLVKLYEGHTDALAILRELGAPAGIAGSTPASTWGTWAAEAPGARTTVHAGPDGAVLLRGRKAWCSGAQHVSHGLLTAWHPGGQGPQLVAVDMRQPGVSFSGDDWHAVGMAASASVDVLFDGVAAVPVGAVGDYLRRPGFWHGGAGVAACWHGGAVALARALHAAVAQAPEAQRTAFRLAALGRVDRVLAGSAALLREAAGWIDAHPRGDARLAALRVRQAAEAGARCVLDEVGRALGATPWCRDAGFARRAADLPVFIRQSHAERDDAAMGECLAQSQEAPWSI